MSLTTLIVLVILVGALGGWGWSAWPAQGPSGPPGAPGPGYAWPGSLLYLVLTLAIVVYVLRALNIG